MHLFLFLVTAQTSVKNTVAVSLQNFSERCCKQTRSVFRIPSPSFPQSRLLKVFLRLGIAVRQTKLEITVFVLFNELSSQIDETRLSKVRDFRRQVTHLLLIFIGCSHFTLSKHRGRLVFGFNSQLL